MATIVNRNKNRFSKKLDKNGKPKPLPANYYIVYDAPDSTSKKGFRQKWIKAGRTYAEARAKKIEIEKELADGTYRSIRKTTFEEFARSWLDEHTKLCVRASTFDRYQTIVNKHLLPTFGQHKLTDIAPAKVQKFVADLSKAGLSPGTVRLILTILKAIFDHAIKLSYLKVNPAASIKAPRLAYKERVFLTPAELKKLIETAGEYKALILFAAMTGARRGEILGLKWGDIDFEKKVVFIRRSVSGNQLSEPKSKSSVRMIAIDDRLADALLAHKIKAPASERDLVFCRQDGSIINPTHLSGKIWKRILKEAKIDKPATFHSLRHSFTSLLANQGENPRVVQELLGHSDIKITLGIYTHLFDETHAEATGKVSAAIFGEDH